MGKVKGDEVERDQEEEEEEEGEEGERSRIQRTPLSPSFVSILTSLLLLIQASTERHAPVPSITADGDSLGDEAREELEALEAIYSGEFEKRGPSSFKVISFVRV